MLSVVSNSPEKAVCVYRLHAIADIRSLRYIEPNAGFVAQLNYSSIELEKRLGAGPGQTGK